MICKTLQRKRKIVQHETEWLAVTDPLLTPVVITRLFCQQYQRSFNIALFYALIFIFDCYIWN
jgi:hypothetical protein